LETVLARGDRRLGKAIYHAWQTGSTFDAWSECFSYDNWLRAFDKVGIDPAFYAYRQRPLEETLPWSHIDTGVSPAFLKKEYHNTFKAEGTPDCKSQCNVCGLESWQQLCQSKTQ
jgi:hypothetical protein